MTNQTSLPRIDDVIAHLGGIVESQAIRVSHDSLVMKDPSCENGGRKPADPGNTLTPPVVIASPASESQVSDLLRLASEFGWKTTPIGASTQRMSGGLMDPVEFGIESLRLNRVLDYSPEDMVVTVQPGLSLASLQCVLAEQGQMLPVDPLCHPAATIGGLVATGVSGPLRTLYGTLRDMVIGLRTVYPSGQIVRTGGKVVKNVAGYDMSKLFIGSFGTLAFISEITFKLRPLPSHVELCLFAGDVDKVTQAVRRIIDSHLITSRMEALHGPWGLTMLPQRLSNTENKTTNHNQTTAAPATNTLQTNDRQFVLAVESHEPKAGSTAQSQALARLGEQLGLDSIILQNDDVHAFWEQYRDRALQERLSVRFTVPPSRAVPFTHSLSRLLASRDALFSATPVAGIGRAFASLSTPDEEVEAVTAIRNAAKEHGGIAVVEISGREVRQSVDPFGATESELKIHRRIKQVIDPRGTLSPNRFLGGI